MQVFAKLGDSQQLVYEVKGECPHGWIVMLGQRPEVGMVAQADGTWGEPDPVFRELSSLEFLSLFNSDERRAIKMASMSDVDIGIWYDDTVAAQFVTYCDARVEAGLAALVADGLLTSARKAEIIAAMHAQ